MAGQPAKGERERFTVRLNRRVVREMRVHCDATEVGFNDLITKIVEQWWAGQGKDREQASAFISQKDATT